MLNSFPRQLPRTPYSTYLAMLTCSPIPSRPSDQAMPPQASTQGPRYPKDKVLGVRWPADAPSLNERNTYGVPGVSPTICNKSRTLGAPLSSWPRVIAGPGSGLHPSQSARMRSARCSLSAVRYRPPAPGVLRLAPASLPSTLPSSPARSISRPASGQIWGTPS